MSEQSEKYKKKKQILIYTITLKEYDLFIGILVNNS